MKDRYSNYYNWSDIEREVNGSRQHMTRVVNRHFDTTLNILLRFMLFSDIPISSVTTNKVPSQRHATACYSRNSPLSRRLIKHSLS